MVNPEHRPSLDIASFGFQDNPQPPSPAPTYRSTFHTQKDYTPQSTSTSGLYWEDEKSFLPAGEEKAHKGEDPPAFQIKPDPHDQNHPHYIPPSQKPRNTLQKSRPTHRRRPRFLNLLPWFLAALFFLTTLWYTSVVAGSRLLHIQPASVNVIINGNFSAGRPVVSITTVAPSPTPDDNTGKPVGDVTSTITSARTGGSVKPTTLTTITTSRK